MDDDSLLAGISFVSWQAFKCCNRFGEFEDTAFQCAGRVNCHFPCEVYTRRVRVFEMLRSHKQLALTHCLSDYTWCRRKRRNFRRKTFATCVSIEYRKAANPKNRPRRLCATPPAKSFAGPMPPSQRHECIRASNLHLRTCEVLNASTQGTKRLSGMPQTKKRNEHYSLP
mgnify:CR=1 FL=1